MPEVVPASLLLPAGSTDAGRGLSAEYFDNPNLEGTPRARRVDEAIAAANLAVTARLAFWDGVLAALRDVPAPAAGLATGA